MAQAVVDGALFAIEPNDESPLAAGLRALTGRNDVAQLDDLGADAVARKAAALLESNVFHQTSNARVVRHFTGAARLRSIQLAHGRGEIAGVISSRPCCLKECSRRRTRLS